MDSADNGYILAFKFRFAVKIILALSFNCSYASSRKIKIAESMNSLRYPTTSFADSTYIGEFHLHFAESNTKCRKNPAKQIIFACREKNECDDNFSLPVFVSRIHGNFVNGVHLHLVICLKICLLSPGTYMHQIVQFFSKQFGLIML